MMDLLATSDLPMCRVEGLIDFIEEIKRRGVAFLNGEDEGESDQRLLTPAQLLHLLRLRGFTRKRNLEIKGG